MGDDDPLAGIDLLAKVPAEERRALARACKWKTVGRGQTVFVKENDNCDVLFVVEGRLNVTGYSLTGKEISFTEIRAGDFLGEIAAIDRQPRSATVSALTSCRIAMLDPTRFSKLLGNHPDIAQEVMLRLTATIRRATERLMDFATLNAQQRICTELLRLANPSPAADGTWTIHPLPTQATMATRIGATRETVARVMSELAKGDLLVRKGRTVTIPDRERLLLLAQRLED